MFSWCAGSTSMRTGNRSEHWKIFVRYSDFGHPRNTKRHGSESRRRFGPMCRCGDQRETFQKLTTILLLTYALRNADCHSKNLALLYTSRTDARLAPAYDFFTTSVYEGYQNNPPGISFMGRKTWLPGKTLGTFITSTFGISQREQKEILERISDAVADTAPAVREGMKSLAGFKNTGKRMLAHGARE